MLTTHQHIAVKRLVNHLEDKGSSLPVIKKYVKQYIDEHCDEGVQMTKKELRDLVHHCIGSKSRYNIHQGTSPCFNVAGHKRGFCRIVKRRGDRSFNPTGTTRLSSHIHQGKRSATTPLSDVLDELDELKLEPPVLERSEPTSSGWSFL